MNPVLDSMQMKMVLKGYSPNTVKTYIRYARNFAQFYQKPFEQMGINEIQKYLYYLLTEKKFSNSYAHANYSALKFLYKSVLKQSWNMDKLPRFKKDKRLPVILAKSEINDIFSTIKNLKHKTIFMTIYSSGLRISEACNLKIKDIDSENMQIHVRQGKGKRDRYTILSKANLKVLRKYWKKYKPNYWLFPGQSSKKPISPRTIQFAFKSSIKKAGIKKDATAHTLRHYVECQIM